LLLVLSLRFALGYFKVTIYSDLKYYKYVN
jgi:hypothetical protein